jgi:hypothetical protein
VAVCVFRAQLTCTQLAGCLLLQHYLLEPTQPDCDLLCRPAVRPPPEPSAEAMADLEAMIKVGEEGGGGGVKAVHVCSGFRTSCCALT